MPRKPIMSRSAIPAAALLAIAATGALLAACSSGTGTIGTGTDTTVDHVTVSGASALTPGQQATLTASAVNASAMALTRTFQWSSSAPAIATVTQGGVVTAVA